MNYMEETKKQEETTQLGIGGVSKRKYWYRDDVTVCVLCGKETHNKVRVYNESEKGTFWEEDACWRHF